jgi:hypothetical protein
MPRDIPGVYRDAVEGSVMTQGKLWGGLLVLFLAGVLTGIVGTILYQHYEQEQRWQRGPAGRQERLMKRLTEELSLTQAQSEAIKPIVGRAHVQILELRAKHQPEVDRIVADGIAELKTKLSAEQGAKLEMLYAKLKQRWQMSRDYLKTAGEHPRKQNKETDQAPGAEQESKP